jgi:hypothetical protein
VSLILENVALNKTAQMSPTTGEESRMTDGTRKQTNNLCTQTNSTYSNFTVTYAQVDLARIYNIYNITIYYGEKCKYCITHVFKVIKIISFTLEMRFLAL